MPKGSTAKKLSSPVETVHKIVRLRAQQLSISDKLQSEYSLLPSTARILAARGFVPGDTLKHFLNPTLKEGLPQPSDLKGLNAACDLIAETIERGERIALCSDFDVDGLSGGAQVYFFLKSIGASVEIHVPDRFEDGYGLNTKMVELIKANKCSLMVTIDYGTTNTKELTLAKDLGLKTIVIDHHHVGEHKPPADVFVNPQQKDCGFAGGVLCAAGLAWYLVVGLRSRIKHANGVDARSYLDLACLGTICDMVPLIGPNRIIAKRGLEVLEKTERVGLNALKQIIGMKKVGCGEVSFGIGPRLNAAGRLVHGNMVIELLTTTDKRRAAELSKQLNDLNLERQETESLVKESALAELRKRGSLDSAIVVWDRSFHTGVIGIVAQRMVELFYRPAAVMGADKEGVFKGSVRGIKGMSVVGVLESAGKYLIKFGGHEGAGGFSVEEKNIKPFAEAFVEACTKALKNIDPVPVAEADTEVKIEEVTVSLVDELKKLAPFGMGNPQPQVLVRGVKVVETKDLKGAHLKATLTDGKKMITGIMWRQTTHPAIKSGNRIDLVCRPDYNNFNGLTEMQLIIQAAALA